MLRTGFGLLSAIAFESSPKTNVQSKLLEGGLSRV